MKKYIILRCEELHNMELEVSKKIEEGYECTGGVSVVKTPASHGMGASYASTIFYQAMALTK